MWWPFEVIRSWPGGVLLLDRFRITYYMFEGVNALRGGEICNSVVNYYFMYASSCGLIMSRWQVNVARKFSSGWILYLRVLLVADHRNPRMCISLIAALMFQWVFRNKMSIRLSPEYLVLCQLLLTVLFSDLRLLMYNGRTLCVFNGMV